MAIAIQQLEKLQNPKHSTESLLNACAGHDLKECTGLAKEKEGEFDQFASSTVSPQKEFIFLRLCVLREVSSSLCMYCK